MVTVIQPLLNEEETAALLAVVDYLQDERADYAALPPKERSSHIYHSVLTLRSCGLFFPRVVEACQSVITPGAQEAIDSANQQAWEFLVPHEYGDWGEVCTEDWLENDHALTAGARLLSSYRTKNNARLWVITEADRSVTTVLLPSEY